MKKIALTDLRKFVAQYYKAELVARVIKGINDDNGEYSKHAHHWVSVLSHCRAELLRATDFLKATISAANKHNAQEGVSHVSISEVLKTEKVLLYFECIFEMFKVCCYLQIWTVNSENQRKPLLSEMEKLKKTWRQLGGLSRKYGHVFPKIKMINDIPTYEYFFIPNYL